MEIIDIAISVAFIIAGFFLGRLHEQKRRMNRIRKAHQQLQQVLGAVLVPVAKLLDEEKRRGEELIQ